jgi:RimJ/RimL family protein N-acetyltransferase
MPPKRSAEPPRPGPDIDAAVAGNQPRLPGCRAPTARGDEPARGFRTALRFGTFSITVLLGGGGKIAICPYRWGLDYATRMTMIYELPPDLFEQARPILGHPPADLAYIDAGLRGVNPARIFVDDPDRPTAALMTRTYEYFVGGLLDTPVTDFIRDAPLEAVVWANFYGFVAVDAPWNEHLRTLHLGLETIGRRTFRFDPEHIDMVRGWSDRVPDGLSIVPLTAELAEMADREMPEIIGMFWSGYQGFAENGFGVLALDGEQPVSTTYAVAVGAGEANIGVMTVPDYRRRGLAKLCSQACIEMAYERDLVATWDCDEPNVASARLALEIGFTEQEPFVELAFPNRAKPTQTADLWIADPIDNGIVAWSKV